MGYYDSEENVQEYVEMAEGYDGRELVAVLARYLAPGATVLELGMGPGKDLALLAAHFQVAGSDSSRVFVDRYRRAHPDADLLLLDAATMDTDRRFDGIYSNKVLQHLTEVAGQSLAPAAGPRAESWRASRCTLSGTATRSRTFRDCGSSTTPRTRWPP